MFGFIKRKIREFTESFSEHAEEEPADATDAPAEEEHVSADASSGAPSPLSSDVSSEDSPGGSDLHSEASPASDVTDAPLASPVSESSETSTDTPADVAQDGTGTSDAISDAQSVSDASADTTRAKSSRAESSTTDRVGTDDVERTSAGVEAGAGERARPQSSIEDEHALSRSDHAETEDTSAREETPERGEPRGFGKLMGALTKRSLSDDAFNKLFTDLEIGLLEANTAYEAVQAVKENLRERLTGQRVSRFSAAQDVSRALAQSIAELFEEPEDLVALADEHAPLVIMLIGINGSGKTTTAAKLARAYQKAGKRPVLAAADTFRAAAIQQLEAHAHALDCRIIKHDYGADPAAVAYDAITHAKSGKADVVIIDTAGRLHSNENLLKELTKLKRVAQPHRVIFVGESIAGNDLIEQAETFNAKIGIDGIILTKTDVDESGGGMLSVSHITRKPIDYLGGGQGYDDLTPFSADVMARLLGLE
ncbi:MAG: signal recognition particle-docking protein FtsY [Candidatus Woesearchaeota archaeon]